MRNDGKHIARISVRVLTLLLLGYTTLRGLTVELPELMGNLGQTSRNLFFHVPMWFAMMAAMFYSVVQSLQFLRNPNLSFDIQSKEAATTGMLFGMLGLVTGIIWSRATWGDQRPDSDFSAWWLWDPKQTTVVICLLIYAAYFLLRSSFDEPIQRARISAVYNIFAAATIVPLFYILPQAMQGLHPGAEGERSTILTLGSEYRLLFWGVALGFIFLAVWIIDLRVRMKKAELILEEAEAEIQS